MKIDFVSDVSCPWCAIGLKSLEEAIRRIGGDADIELHFQPFELNPDMGAEGEDIEAHIGRKYGITPQQIAQNGERITQRGAELGFTFHMDRRRRIYNTFDAHRLLHWAGLEGRQHALKAALLRAYFTDGESPADHEVLVRAATEAGLDAERAREVLSSQRYATEVREREAFYQAHGIHAVPSVIVDDRHLIQGGQPPEVFEQVLRRLAAGEGQAA